jgi:hypothetical protein
VGVVVALTFMVNAPRAAAQESENLMFVDSSGPARTMKDACTADVLVEVTATGTDKRELSRNGERTPMMVTAARVDRSLGLQRPALANGDMLDIMTHTGTVTIDGQLYRVRPSPEIALQGGERYVMLLKLDADTGAYEPAWGSRFVFVARPTSFQLIEPAPAWTVPPEFETFLSPEVAFDVVQWACK